MLWRPGPACRSQSGPACRLRTIQPLHAGRKQVSGGIPVHACGLDTGPVEAATNSTLPSVPGPPRTCLKALQIPGSRPSRSLTQGPPDPAVEELQIRRSTRLAAMGTRLHGLVPRRLAPIVASRMAARRGGPVSGGPVSGGAPPRRRPDPRRQGGRRSRPARPRTRCNGRTRPARRGADRVRPGRAAARRTAADAAPQEAHRSPPARCPGPLGHLEVVPVLRTVIPMWDN